MCGEVWKQAGMQVNAQSGMSEEHTVRLPAFGRVIDVGTVVNQHGCVCHRMGVHDVCDQYLHIVHQVN